MPPLNQTYGLIRPSVARIETSSGRGTAWAVGQDLLITAYHVVEGDGSEVSAYLPSADGEIAYKATVLGWDRLRDIAVLRVPGTVLKPLTTRKMHTEDPPEQVLAVGWAFGVPGYPGVKLGVITTVGKYPTLSDLGFFESDAAFDPGDSGGPVVDLQGHVVGIIQATRTATSTGQRLLGRQLGLTVRSIDEVFSNLVAGMHLNNDSKYWYLRGN